MSKILIKYDYEENPIICKFTNWGGGLRMYMQAKDSWYPSIGWCPHLDIGGGECRDCALVLEEDE